MIPSARFISLLVIGFLILPYMTALLSRVKLLRNHFFSIPITVTKTSVAKMSVSGQLPFQGIVGLRIFMLT